MKVLIESMTKVAQKYGVHDYTIRVWREEPSDQQSYRTRTQGEILDALHATKYITTFETASGLLALDRVSAVEVVDETGCGVVLYKDWP